MRGLSNYDLIIIAARPSNTSKTLVCGHCSITLEDLGVWTMQDREIVVKLYHEACFRNCTMRARGHRGWGNDISWFVVIVCCNSVV